MSFECLSATLPKKGGLLRSFQTKISNISGLHDRKKENNGQAQTPTSGSSSGTIRKASFDADETSSQPDLVLDESQTRHSPNTLFSPEEMSLAGSPDLDFRILPSPQEPQSALFKSPQKLGSFFGPMKTRKSMLTEFDDDFYERIGDFLDQEGIDIVLPAECDQSMIAGRTAVRKLLIERTLSENVIGMKKDIAFGIDFGDSPGLANTVQASSLVMRRTSLGHASSNEIEEAHQTMLIKKSLFESELKELNEIVEVSETQTLSRRSSFIFSRGSKKTTRKMTGGRESEWDDSFSDLQRSVTKHSTQNSTYLCLADDQVKSLSKLSPDMKPTALSSRRANFYSPQVALKTFNFEQAKKSPLAMFCKKSSVREKKIIEITPFGGLGSNQAISDISPQLRVSLNE